MSFVNTAVDYPSSEGLLRLLDKAKQALTSYVGRGVNPASSDSTYTRQQVDTALAALMGELALIKYDYAVGNTFICVGGTVDATQLLTTTLYPAMQVVNSSNTSIGTQCRLTVVDGSVTKVQVLP